MRTGLKPLTHFSRICQKGGGYPEGQYLVTFYLLFQDYVWTTRQLSHFSG
jgi:hypothetical protein